MIASLDKLPKEAKALPPPGQEIYLKAYNADFGWRCSESHADKAAWRAVHAKFEQREDGTWQAK